MKVTELETRSWKGISEITPIHPLNLFVGPNGSGKTARLCALQYGVMGETPLGKTADDAMALVGPQGGGVKITLDDGFTFNRSVSRDREGAVTNTARVAGHENVKLRDSQEMISQKCGRFSPMFDLSVFTGLSVDKRRDAILNLCGMAEGCDIEELISRIRLKYLEESLGVATATDILAGKLRGKSEQALDAEERFMLCLLLEEKLSESERKALDSAMIAIRGALREASDKTTAIAMALSEAKTSANLTKRSHTENNAAANKLAQEREGLRVVAESVEALREREAKLQTQRDGLRSDIDKHDAWQMQVEKARRGVIMAEANVAESETALEAAKRKAEQAADYRNQADEWDAKARGRAVAFADPIDSKHIVALQAKIRDLEAMADACARHINESNHRRLETESAAQSLRAEIERVKGDPWRVAQGMLRAFMDAAKTLQVVQDDVAYGLMELDKHIQNQLKGPTLSELTMKLQDAERAAESAHAGWTGAKARAEQSIIDLADHRKGLDELVGERNKQQDAILVARDEIREATMTAESLRREAAQAEAELDRSTKAVTEARQRLLDLRRIQDESHTAAGNINRELTAENLHQTECQIGELNVQINSKVQYSALEAKLQSTRAAAERALVEHETFKKLADAVRVFRDQLMGELVEPLISRVDKFLAATGKDVTAYATLEDARGKPCLDLGWRTDTQRIPLEAMSGGETALFSAALAYALIMLGDPELKLLLIEAAELDAVHMTMLLAALEACGDDVGNVIVATHKADMVIGEGWNVITCGRSELVGAA